MSLTSRGGGSRRRQPSRPGSGVRRPSARTLEPPDYRRDYAFVRRDLIWIGVWGGLLMAGMIIVALVL